MGVTDTYDRGRDLVVERPGIAVVGLAVVVLAVDLVRQLAVGATSISQIATFVWNGTVIGLVIGLAGIGLSLTYSILGFANFAHGDYLTTGAFAGWAASFVVAGIGQADFGVLALLGNGGNIGPRALGISITADPVAVFLGLVVAVVATVGVVLFLDRVVYRPMRDAGSISLLIASVGVALALRYSIVFVWQTNTRGLTAAGLIPGFRVPVVDGTVSVDAHEVTLVVAAVALMFGVHVLLQRTKFGTAMRAMADNKDLARVTGIPTERVIRATWIIGGGLAGAAGYLTALERGTIGFNLGWLLLLLIFAAVILGGIGSVYGAIVGGLAIGIVSRISLLWLPSGFARAAAFLIMILILLFRPDGIFGGVTTA